MAGIRYKDDVFTHVERVLVNIRKGKFGKAEAQLEWCAHRLEVIEESMIYDSETTEKLIKEVNILKTEL